MSRVAPQLAAVVGVLVALAAGIWLWGAIVAPGFWSAIVLITAWFLVLGALTTRLGRRLPSLRLALRGTYLVAAVVTVLVGYLTSVRTTEVDEPLVTGTPASRVAPAPTTPGGPAAPDVNDLLAPQ